ncbi:hypothetical protein NUW58_g8455 [Xylaria curta]|uniref:Uncharacterized protein n=1 Tax=Xylaria curta TaxID=42375 RepID=A0ACC1N9G2_9PEZI|nr:hypothetical protein NUW58_g8455 [Xylaria curta]
MLGLLGASNGLPDQAKQSGVFTAGIFSCQLEATFGRLELSFVTWSFQLQAWSGLTGGKTEKLLWRTAVHNNGPINVSRAAAFLSGASVQAGYAGVRWALCTTFEAMQGTTSTVDEKAAEEVEDAHVRRAMMTANRWRTSATVVEVEGGRRGLAMQENRAISALMRRGGVFPGFCTRRPGEAKRGWFQEVSFVGGSRVEGRKTNSSFFCL